MVESPSPLRIKQLCIYPIKSLRGCTLPSMHATPTGFQHDRRFMLQRVSDEKHMAVARNTEMCLFTTELLLPLPLHGTGNGTGAEKTGMVSVGYIKDHVFNDPGRKLVFTNDDDDDDGDGPEVLKIPLEPDWVADGLRVREYNMHGSPTTGYEMGERYNRWFSRRVGYQVRLIYLGDNRRRVLGTVSPDARPIWMGDGGDRVDANVNTGGGWFGAITSTVGSLVGKVAGPTGEEKENPVAEEEQYKGVDQGISFADCAPFLVVSNKSYEDAAARLKEDDLDILKFRPNIVIEGADEAFEEDYWAELAIGSSLANTDTRIVLTSNCARCASLNVDFDTGKPGTGEAGKILKLLQKDRRVDHGMKYSPIFGRYGFLATKGQAETEAEVEIKVGDVVRVVRRNDLRTRFHWPGISTDR